MHCAIANRHLGLSAKKMGHKGGQRQVHDVCIVHTAVCKKAHLGMKRRRTVKKSSPKFFTNLLEAFRIVLKALLGLAIPNQYCQGARMEL